jgi:hypothetical protein
MPEVFQYLHSSPIWCNEFICCIPSWFRKNKQNWKNTGKTASGPSWAQLELSSHSLRVWGFQAYSTPSLSGYIQRLSLCIQSYLNRSIYRLVGLLQSYSCLPA